MPDGEDAEFTALYDRYYRSVLGYALRRALPEQAQDAVAETFLVAWRHRGERHDNELAWLLAVTKNVLRQQVRSGSRREALDAELRRVSDLAVGATGDVAAEVVERIVVLQALESLSEADREALMLAAWDGLSARQAAQVVGCSVPAFWARLRRARGRLAAELRRASPAFGHSGQEVPVDPGELEAGRQVRGSEQDAG
jgi:RNA polymerase sigma-70 factor (ECF subfamily)